MPRKRASAGTANPDVQNDDGEAQNPPKKPRFTTFGWAFALFRICSFHLQKLHGWTVRVAARAPKEEKEKTPKNQCTHSAACDWVRADSKQRHRTVYASMRAAHGRNGRSIGKPDSRVHRYSREHGFADQFEKRQAEDGYAYYRHEFFDWYGPERGEAEWQKAHIATSADYEDSDALCARAEARLKKQARACTCMHENTYMCMPIDVCAHRVWGAKSRTCRS